MNYTQRFIDGKLKAKNFRLARIAQEYHRLHSPIVNTKKQITDSRDNYCKSGTMSTCTAEDKWEKCRFEEKASHENRCMYLVFDEYCECLKAQIDSRNGNGK